MVNDDKVQEGKFRENATDSANLQQGSFSEEVKNSDRKEEVNGALIKMVKVMGVEHRVKTFVAEKKTLRR